MATRSGTRTAYFEGIGDETVGLGDDAADPAVDQKADPALGQQDGVDPVQDKLLEIIEAKRKKTKRPTKAERLPTRKATPNNVINIMDALRKSVEAENRPGKR